jgi:hypothetical protein
MTTPKILTPASSSKGRLAAIVAPRRGEAWRPGR